jgi:hypothetical protein
MNDPYLLMQGKGSIQNLVLQIVLVTAEERM